MRDHHELRIRRHLQNQPVQPPDIRLVQRRVHLVHHTERTRLVAEDRHQQRHRRQRLLSAREQQHVLQPLARRRADNIDPAIGHILLVRQPHLTRAAAKQRLEAHPEVRVDRFERLLELLPRDQIDLLNRPLRIPDRIDQVLPLRAQEVVALLRLLILFHRRRIHRAQRFDAPAHLVRRLLGFRDRLRVRHRFVRRNQFLHRDAQLLAARLVQVLQFRLLAHQVDFHLRPLLLRLLRRRPQTLQIFLVDAQRLAHPRVLRGHLVDLRIERRDLFGQLRRLAVQLDVVRQQPRPLFTQPRNLRRDCVAPVRGLAELMLQPPHRGTLPAIALFQPRQFGANHRVLFHDGGRLPFQLLQFAALRL